VDKHLHSVQVAVDLKHELVEVAASREGLAEQSFTFIREQVHEEALAAPDRAVEVSALDLNCGRFQRLGFLLLLTARPVFFRRPRLAAHLR